MPNLLLLITSRIKYFLVRVSSIKRVNYHIVGKLVFHCYERLQLFVQSAPSITLLSQSSVFQKYQTLSQTKYIKHTYLTSATKLPAIVGAMSHSFLNTRLGCYFIKYIFFFFNAVLGKTISFCSQLLSALPIE